MSRNGNVEAVIISGSMKGEIVQLDSNNMVRWSDEELQWLDQLATKLNKSLDRLDHSIAESAKQYREAAERLRRME